MKKLLVLLLSFLPVLGYAQLTDYVIDEKATQEAPYKKGDIITGVELTFSSIRSGMQDASDTRISDAYRVFRGVTNQGGYLVQDFYQLCTEEEKLAHGLPSQENAKTYKCQADVKLSDPFVLSQPMESLGTNTLIDYFDYYGLKLSRGCSQDVVFPPFYKSISGTLILWYPNQQKSLEGTFKNGIADGVWKTWYGNGNKRTEVPYINGLESGVTTVWSENGEKSREYESKDGKFHGSYFSWWRDGSKEERHYENDLLHGFYKEWDEDGKLVNKIQYEKGERVSELGHKKDVAPCVPPVEEKKITASENGLVTCYTNKNYLLRYAQKKEEYICRFIIGKAENGNDIMQDFYVNEYSDEQPPAMLPTDTNALKYTDPFEVISLDQNDNSEDFFRLADFYANGGRFAGAIKIWYLDGTPKLEGNYDSTGKKQGVWTRWYANGQKNYEIAYSEGLQDGKSTFWREDGSKQSEDYSIKGKCHGIEKNWCSNGTLSSETQWVDGEMEGLATYWYCNGQKQSEGQMSENYKVGIWKEWNKDGVQIQEFDYSQIPVELQQSR